jgi:hypothetical protein
MNRRGLAPRAAPGSFFLSFFLVPVLFLFLINILVFQPHCAIRQLILDLRTQNALGMGTVLVLRRSVCPW